MFTGIIESVQKLAGIRQEAGKTKITIARPEIFKDIKNGSSICCDGICLTVTEFDTTSFTVEIMNETMKKTSAGKWKTGDEINLERALQIGGRLDGHWVQGHVDSTSPMLITRTENSTLYLTFALSSEYESLVVPQGSISINGVSLTISGLKPDRFTVALIGHTIDNTNLPKLSIGNKVNLEFDVLGKYILRKKQQTSLNEEFLHEHGF